MRRVVVDEHLEDWDFGADDGVVPGVRFGDELEETAVPLYSVAIRRRVRRETRRSRTGTRV